MGKSGPFFWFLLAALGLSVSVLAEGSADAACPPEPLTSPPAPTPDIVAKSQSFFQSGVRLAAEGDFEGACKAFQASRSLVPRVSNTQNVALCLSTRGRFPEALATYEDLLARFDVKELDPALRAKIEEAIRDLHGKISIVTISGGEGALFIDNQSCGALPREGPVYLLPGDHVLADSRPSDNDDYVASFSTEAGAAKTIVIPPRPKPAAPSVGEGWFLSASLGWALGWSGIDGGSHGSDGSEEGSENLRYMSGLFFAGRGGYRLPLGFSFELTSGLLSISSKLPTVKNVTFPATIDGEAKLIQASYDMHRSVELYAPFMGLGFGFEPRFGKRVGLSVRTVVGLLASQARENITGTISSPIGSIDNVVVEGRVSPLYSAPLFAMVDLGLRAHFGRLSAGASLAGLMYFVNGPSFGAARVGVDGASHPCNPAKPTIGCVPIIELDKGLLAYRRTLLFVPQVSLGVDL